MRGVNIDPRVHGNGAHLNGVPRKRAAKPAPAEQTPPLSGFVVVPAQPAAAQMWPVHAVMWLEPVLTAVAPGSSGVGIQRRYGVPASDFIYSPVAPSDCPRPPEQVTTPLLPDFGQGIPKSDLSPLGWDPRAVGIAGDKEPK
jgi:hypothetical protein